MFKFTSTNVINKNQDSTGKALFTPSTTENSFYVKRVNNFKVENIVAAYYSPYVAPRFAKATLDLNDVESPGTEDNTPVKGEHYRLSLYIRLDQSNQSSYYSNDMVFKGKPLSVEFVWKDDPEKTAEYLANIIRKYEIAVYEKPIVKVSADGGVLTIDATDLYQRFHTVELEWYDAEKYHGMGEYIPVLKAVPEKIGEESEGKITYKENPELVGNNKITQGYEGFGTYEYILHNLRLPTKARTRYLAQNQDESPIPGAHYDEFVIKYCVNRGIMGNNAVGDLVTSMTTHVFYVNHDISKDFKEGLELVLLNSPKGVELETVVSEYVKQVLEPIEDPEDPNYPKHDELDNEGR